MTGFIVLETREGPRLSDLWQQRTRSQLCLAHVTPRKTLFTPSHAPLDLAMLAPCKESYKSYLDGSTLTLHDTWLGSATSSEESVICNLECSVAHLSHCCHLESRSAVSAQEVDLLPPFSVAVDLLIQMPGAPTRSTMRNLAASRQKVGNPKNLGAHPNSHFLKHLSKSVRSCGWKIQGHSLSC